MLNIGAGEIAVILVVALLVLGPKRLPELARGIGKFLREFRRQTDEVRTTLETEFYRMDREIMREDVKPVVHGDEQRALPSIQGPLDGGRRPADELFPPAGAAGAAAAGAAGAAGATDGPKEKQPDPGDDPPFEGEHHPDHMPEPVAAPTSADPEKARNVLVSAHRPPEPLDASAPAPVPVPAPESAPASVGEVSSAATPGTETKDGAR